MKEWRNISKGSEYESNLYEANIPPLIRFIHYKKINPSGWIKLTLDTNKASNEITDDIDCMDFKSSIEIICISKNIEVLDKNNISNYIIASYDIECDSSHGDFPLAIKNMKKLARDIFNIYFHKEL